MMILSAITPTGSSPGPFHTEDPKPLLRQALKPRVPATLLATKERISTPVQQGFRFEIPLTDSVQQRMQTMDSAPPPPKQIAVVVNLIPLLSRPA